MLKPPTLTDSLTTQLQPKGINDYGETYVVFRDIYVKSHIHLDKEIYKAVKVKRFYHVALKVKHSSSSRQHNLQIISL